jgi:hypothetical protein
MNKLEVALKLLQLLNERKTIDSKTVAHELNVSIRTAQRYLVELSILPCVTTKQEEHSYTLNADYRLNAALRNGHASPALPAADKPAQQKQKPAQPESVGKTICLLCGGRGMTSKGGATMVAPPHSNNLTRINRLAAIISKRLKSSKCPFP